MSANPQVPASLLDLPCFTARIDSGTEAVTLPGLLALVAAEDRVALPRLQPHQDHVVYLFLAQLGLLATRPGEDLPVSEAEWRQRLLDLSAGAEEPWRLHKDAVEEVAFLQPPDPAGAKQYKLAASTPDAIDTLATAKNHDVKRQRVGEPDHELWIYALISVQTSDGFLGAGNYGVARMNGGYGSRPLVGTARSLDWGVRFRDDLAMAHAASASILSDFEYDPDGHGLLWLLPWDGTGAIPRTACRPHFVEVCRRLWLRPDGAWTATSRTGRVDAKEEKGRIGDPWIPIRRKDGAALSVTERGFDRRQIAQLLRTDEWAMPVAAGLPVPAWWILQALARSQGGTEGYHQRFIPIPPPARLAFARQMTGMDSPLGGQAEEHNAAADRMRKKVLYSVLSAVAPPGGDHPKHLIDSFEDRVEAAFVEHLWPIVEDGADAERVLLQWEVYLAQEAFDVLMRAVRAMLPRGRDPAGRGKPDVEEEPALAWVWKRSQEVQGRFVHAVKKHFPTVYEENRMPRASFRWTPVQESAKTFLQLCRRDGGGPAAGDLAALRRWSPDQPPSMEVVKWSVVSGSGTSSQDLAALQAVAFLHGQHVPKADVGGALFRSGLSPMRIERLLSAPESGLLSQFRQVVQRLAATGEAVDVLALTRLLAHHDTDVRLAIARSYYRAEHGASVGETHA